MTIFVAIIGGACAGVIALLLCFSIAERFPPHHWFAEGGNMTARQWMDRLIPLAILGGGAALAVETGNTSYAAGGGAAALMAVVFILISNVDW